MTNPKCEVCCNEVETIYEGEEVILCDRCGENHASEGFSFAR